MSEIVLKYRGSRVYERVHSGGVLTSLSFTIMTLNQATVLEPLKRTRLAEQKAWILRLQLILVNSQSVRHGALRIYCNLRVSNQEKDVLSRRVFARDARSLSLADLGAPRLLASWHFPIFQTRRIQSRIASRA